MKFGLQAVLLAAVLGSTPARAGRPDPQRAEPEGSGEVSTLDAPKSAEALLDVLRRAPGFSALFVEEKTLAVLQRPLVTRGRMIFRRSPPTLVRELESPPSTRVVVTADRLSTVRGEAVEHLELAGRPEAQALVGSLLALLRGDGEALAAAYALEFVSEGKGWTLALRPKSSRLSALVSKLTFKGHGEALDELVIEEASGDRTVTRVSALAWRTRPDPADAPLFAVP